MNDRLKDAESIVTQMEENSNLSKVEELIRDNKISFEHKEQKYRVRLLNNQEKRTLDEMRSKKYGQMLQDKDILMEKDLIKQYKEREIDIDKITEEIQKLNSQDFDVQIKLGEAISKKDSTTVLNAYKEQILDLRTKKHILDTQKTLLLEFSLENQLLSYVSMIITFLSSDILIEGIWQRCFKTFEEFEVCEDNKLIDKLAQFSMFLQYI
jgi:hypothetical protein